MTTAHFADDKIRIHYNRNLVRKQAPKFEEKKKAGKDSTMKKLERYTPDQINKIEREWEDDCNGISSENPNPDCCVKCFFFGKGICDVYPADYDDDYYDKLVELLAEFKTILK